MAHEPSVLDVCAPDGGLHAVTAKLEIVNMSLVLS